MTAAVDRVLDRVVGVKQVGTLRWIGRCSAHADKSPSLSIRGTDDGRVLLHCFAGCEVGAVLDALGLSFSDLFDKPLNHHLPPVRGGFTARELLELNCHEAMVAALLADKAQTEPLTAEESKRLTQAAERLVKASTYVCG